MNEDKKLAAMLLISFIVLLVLIIGLCGCIARSGLTEVAVAEPVLAVSDKVYTEEDRLSELAEKDGYDNLFIWKKDLEQIKSEFEGSAAAAEEIYIDYLSEELINNLYEYEENILKAETITEINEWKDRFNEAVAIGEETKIAMETAYIEQNYYSYSPSYDTPSSGLTAYTGVNYYDDRRETYYSSNVAYHYRTNEWYVDNEGFYRTEEGYYVVAASDMEQGTTFEGSKGTCVVLDSGCDEGTTDYYVNW